MQLPQQRNIHLRISLLYAKEIPWKKTLNFVICIISHIMSGQFWFARQIPKKLQIKCHMPLSLFYLN